ncbi:MAG TPA: hypothetical protein VEQ35_04805, partial [Beijerinckia sp.]|nr:hypothetical protein [Beijerinckia sp.]
AELRVSAGADERDPTFHSRVRHHPLVAAFENGGRPSLMSRMAARLVEVAALLEALAKDTLPDIYHPVRVGASAAAVCAARGQLFHEAEVTNGVVSLYRITTPTDWMLAQGGLLDQIIAAFEANPPTFQRSALTLLIGSIDPGVPYRIEEVEDA